MTTHDKLDLLINFVIMAATVTGLLGVFLQIRRGATAQAADFKRQRENGTIEFYRETFAKQNEWRKDLPNDRDSAAIQGRILRYRVESSRHDVATQV